MWQVVVRKDGNEIGISEAMPWGEAFSQYRKDAKSINAVNKDGEYMQPDTRISIRKAPAQSSLD